MTVKPRGRLPRKAFRTTFGFDPVRGEGTIRETQRGLERTIVAHELLSIWRMINRCETELQQRDPQTWMRTRVPGSVPDRHKLQQHLGRLTRRYAEAERLAKAFGLHPEQHEQS